MKQIIKIKSSLSVLVVEDNEERIAYFREKLAGMNVTVCMTPQKALNVLGVHRFDVIFLDHDAVPSYIDKYDPDHDDKTFFRVAQLLAKTNYEGDVIIHSWNVIGAARMALLLGRNAKVTRALFGSFELVKEY